MSDYDDDRPNWRDIDRNRDKSRHVGSTEKKVRKEGPGNRYQTGRVKEALDRLFMGEKGTVEHDKAYAKIHSTYGTTRFLSAVQKYVDLYGFPDDVRSLVLILDSKDEAFIMGTLEKLKTIAPNLPVRQKEDVRRKLSIMALTEKSATVKEGAGEVLELVSS